MIMNAIESKEKQHAGIKQKRKGDRLKISTIPRKS